jgi:hypothetical protein
MPEAFFYFIGVGTVVPPPVEGGGLSSICLATMGGSGTTDLGQFATTYLV